MTIYPTLFTDSLVTVKERLALVAESDARVVQVDVIDGIFADEITVAPLDLVNIDFQDIQCDLHLMVDEPMDFVYEAESVKTHLPIRSIIAQIEHMSYQASYLEELRQQQWRRGLSLNIFTPLEEIEPTSWLELDILQLMGNEAGREGQELHPALVPKLKEAAAYIKENELNIEVIVDIGVTPANILALAAAGATGFAMGSGSIWRSPDPVATINELSSLEM